MPLGGTGQLPSSTRIAVYIRITVAVIILAILAYLIHPLSAAESFGLYTPRRPIPGIVHYVYIKQNADSHIDFSFANFLSVFAAIQYVNPTKVYIHSDYSKAEIAHAGTKGGHWTRKLINTFPEVVEWNQIRIPEYAGANENVRIDAIQHKSDFIRWEQIVDKGGIYMDWDVVALRPLTPLMNAGFAFIAGRQYGGKDEGGQINGTINNGAFLTRPHSAMARIMTREQNAGFNGEWAYNLQFMTSVAERLVAIPGEVLITDRHAFAPTHWFPESKDEVFLSHDGPASPEPIKINSTDPLELYDTMVQNRRSRREWEMDLSATYMLHAFGQGQYNEHITPKRVLARNSNYGVATWPSVKKMVKDGIVKGTEDNWQ